MFLYTVYDRLAEEAGPVFEAKNDPVALRNYANLLNSVQKTANPDEYELWCVGEMIREDSKFHVSSDSSRYPFRVVTGVDHGK